MVTPSAFRWYFSGMCYCWWEVRCQSNSLLWGNMPFFSAFFLKKFGEDGGVLQIYFNHLFCSGFGKLANLTTHAFYKFWKSISHCFFPIFSFYSAILFIHILGVLFPNRAYFSIFSFSLSFCTTFLQSLILPVVFNVHGFNIP